MWRCRACVTAVLAVLPVLDTAAMLLPGYCGGRCGDIDVTRRHESSTAPTGGAAQLVAPQRARGSAADSSALIRSTRLLGLKHLEGDRSSSAIRTIVVCSRSTDVGPRVCRGSPTGTYAEAADLLVPLTVPVTLTLTVR